MAVNKAGKVKNKLHLPCVYVGVKSIPVLGDNERGQSLCSINSREHLLGLGKQERALFNPTLQNMSDLTGPGIRR